MLKNFLSQHISNRIHDKPATHNVDCSHHDCSCVLEVVNQLSPLYVFNGENLNRDSINFSILGRIVLFLQHTKVQNFYIGNNEDGDVMMYGGK